MKFLLALILLPFAIGICTAQREIDQRSPEPGGVRCGTPDILANHNHLDDADHDYLEEKGRALAGLMISRPIKQHAFRSTLGHFLVHYDTSGPDAVSAADGDHNGIPDYVDSAAYYLEYAWQIEIDQYGYVAPTDNNRQGPEVDAYIVELARQYYGYAVPEEDNPTGLNTLSGFLVVDNDYTRYPTPGIDGLRVTTAHEFHHVVQFSRYKADYAQGSIYEATSVWFEQQVHPAIDDYRQYADSMIIYPQYYGFSTHKIRVDVTGYTHELLMEFLSRKFGRDIVREIWQEFSKQENCQDAIDIALRRHGTDATDSYCELAEWCYRCGRRARDTAFFRAAPIYPTMRAAVMRNIRDDHETVAGRLYPLSFGLYEATIIPRGGQVRDTVNFLITNGRIDFGRGGLGTQLDEFTLELDRQPRAGYRALPMGQDTLYYRLNAPSAQFCVEAIVGGANVVLAATTISPQPFLNDGGTSLVFGIRVDNEQVTSTDLKIYSSTLEPVARVQQSELRASDNLLGVLWDGRDAHGERAPSGVYIYTLSINGGPEVMGKFAVIRK